MAGITNAIRQTGKPTPGPVAACPAGGPELTDAEFFGFCQLVHRHAGIYLSPAKKELVRARLVKILRQRGLDSFKEYYEQILADKSGVELVTLLDALSTNQTAFWREPGHFQFLAREILPGWRQAGRPVSRAIWSAGCSSGEEPYTLAMVCLDSLGEAEVSRLKIYATDINTQVLAQAAQGVYAASRLEALPPEWRRRFFQQGMRKWEGFYRVKPEVRRLVQFSRLNLMEALPFREELDVIFCRNVMIYFEKDTQMKLVNKFYQCLKPGGYLFIGHSESLCNHQHRFLYVKPTIYRK